MLYYNILKAEDNTKGIFTNATDRAKIDVCGDRIGTYEFTLFNFKSLSNYPVFYGDSDLTSSADMQEIIDWVNSTPLRPDFWENIYIDEISTYTDTPEFANLEQTEVEILAKYMVRIKIDYIEKGE